MRLKETFELIKDFKLRIGYGFQIPGKKKMSLRNIGGLMYK